MTNLDLSTSVGDWVAQRPGTSRVFEKLGIDYCCGGRKTLQQACDDQQVDARAVMNQLQNAVDHSTPSVADWTAASLTELCDHIEQTHHAYLRGELPQLTELFEKVVAAHGETHPELTQLSRVFAALRAELEPHMFKEEQILFPAIRQLERSASPPAFPFGTVANPIRMMAHEHDNAGRALAEIRQLTDDFQPPENACNSYRVLYERLRGLEADMHQHVHKENNILFPRAIGKQEQPVA
mgnify:CR=1 FL=1